jgi:hypothetical protein
MMYVGGSTDEATTDDDSCGFVNTTGGFGGDDRPCHCFCVRSEGASWWWRLDPICAGALQQGFALLGPRL